MLKVEKLGGFNVFDWPAFKCPLCQGSEFVSHDHSAIWCVGCNAKFQTRHTAGDPGVVVDCYVAEKQCNAFIYAPKHECKKCGVKKGLLDWQDKTCPKNMNHVMEPVPNISLRWEVPDDMKDEQGETRFCLVLKLGDYCSGWMKCWKSMDHLKFPTQKEWDAFQEQMESERELEQAIREVVG